MSKMLLNLCTKKQQQKKTQKIPQAKVSTENLPDMLYHAVNSRM